MMTSRERVRRAVLFQGPDQVPRSLPQPWGTDFLCVGVDSDPNWKPKKEGEDEWGCVWSKLQGDKTMGQVVFHPLDDYAKLNDYPFPNYDLDERYEKTRKVITENRDEKFILAGIPLSFIHRLEYLRGHAEAWTDWAVYPDQLHDLLTRMGDIAIDAIKHMADAGAHGIISCDDWGLQDRPMISPEAFREHFKPHYARVYREAQNAGLLCFLHSCGYISDLLDDFIDAGLHVIQMDQQENMGVKDLATRFGGRLCFWCPVDIQKTMILGSLDDIRAYARMLIHEFGRFNGGFISKWYPSPDAVNHTPEKINAMAEAFTTCSRYPLAASEQ